MKKGKKNSVLFFLFATFSFAACSIYSQEKTFDINKSNYAKFAEEGLYDLLNSYNFEKGEAVYSFIVVNNIDIKDENTKGLFKLFEGTFERERSANESAKKSFLAAYYIFESTHNIMYKAYAANMLAIVNCNLEEVYFAIKYYKEAIDYFDDTKFYNFTMISSFNMQNAYIELDKYDKALEYGLKSYNIVKKHNIENTSVKYLYMNLAKCYIEKGDFESAYLFQNKAKNLINDAHKRGKAVLYSNYIKIYNKNNNKELASIYKDSLIDASRMVHNINISKINSLNSKEKKVSDSINKINLDALKKRQQFLYTLFGFALLLSLLLFYLFKLNNNLKNEQVNVMKLLKEKERNLMSKVFNISTKNDLFALTASRLENLLSVEGEIKKSSLLTIIKDIEKNVNKNEVWEEFQIHFEKTNPDFFKKLRKKNNSLTVKDLRLSAYILANLSTKDIASLVGVSVRSVETSKYRLKRKLELSREVSLTQFLGSL